MAASRRDLTRDSDKVDTGKVRLGSYEPRSGSTKRDQYGDQHGLRVLWRLARQKHAQGSSRSSLPAACFPNNAHPGHGCCVLWGSSTTAFCWFGFNLSLYPAALLLLLLLTLTEAESIIKEARAEVSAMVNKQKGEKQAELDKIYADAKAKVTRETESAIAGGSHKRFCSAKVDVVRVVSKGSCLDKLHMCGWLLTKHHWDLCLGGDAADRALLLVYVPTLNRTVSAAPGLLHMIPADCVLCKHCAVLCAAAMEKESEGLLKSLDAQAEKISDQVLKRVLPEGVKV